MKNYFTLLEMVKTDTGLDNSVEDLIVIRNLEKLMLVLSVVRHLIRKPITVNSGYRSAIVNEAVGGVPNSLHRYGLAADITCCDNEELHALCLDFYKHGIFNECIYYPEKEFIHISI